MSMYVNGVSFLGYMPRNGIVEAVKIHLIFIFDTCSMESTTHSVSQSPKTPSIFLSMTWAVPTGSFGALLLAHLSLHVGTPPCPLCSVEWLPERLLARLG